MRYKLACERGALVMELDLAPGGQIGGFIGESRDVPLRVGTSDLKLKVERKGSNVVITSEK